MHYAQRLKINILDHGYCSENQSYIFLIVIFILNHVGLTFDLKKIVKYIQTQFWNKEFNSRTFWCHFLDYKVALKCPAIEFFNLCFRIMSEYKAVYLTIC